MDSKVSKDSVQQLHVRSNIRAGQGGGYVNGVFYPDKSGVCGSSTSPSPQPPISGGGYVGGVFYPDKSGVCGSGTGPTPSPGGGYVGGVFYPDKSGTC